MSHRPESILRLVESFFRDYLQRVRGASPHTIAAYRDTLRLFFVFLGKSCGRDVADLGIEHLTVEQVMAFLDHLEADRRNATATRNLRLTALRSLFRHLVREDPARAGQYQRVLSLPSKKARTPVISYLEPEEMRVLLAQPDLRKPREARDHALLIFLYNTGARISEALRVRWSEVQLGRPRQVHLHGKGRKDRILPLWPDTGRALRRLLALQPSPANGLVFCNARGQPLGRDGAAYILAKYINRAAARFPALRRKRVTPHVLRHSCTVALLQGGVDVSAIRDYLGHESIATTGRYTKTNLQMKRRVLDAFWRRAGLTREKDPRWRPAPDLLALLASLSGSTPAPTAPPPE
jgi:site-specific recombinase XerD